MLKLQHKLEYAINLGVDFLLRNVNEDGIIADEDNIHRHSLAALCLAENIKDSSDRLNLVLSRIASCTYSNKSSFFIIDENESSKNDVNAIAAMVFFKTKKQDWGEKYANTVMKEMNSDDSAGICCRMFIKAYEILEEKRWLEKAKDCAYQILEDGKLSDLWNMIALNELDRHHVDERFRNFTISMISNHPTFDIYANYGKFFGSDWKEKIQMLAYENLELQQSPSNEWKGGAFLDEYGKARIDWTQRYVNSFSRCLKILKKVV